MTGSVGDTCSYIVKGGCRAVAHASHWIYRSQWFMVTPLPDDHWRFEIKSENAHHITDHLVPSFPVKECS